MARIQVRGLLPENPDCAYFGLKMTVYATGIPADAGNFGYQRQVRKDKFPVQ